MKILYQNKEWLDEVYYCASYFAEINDSMEVKSCLSLSSH